jgi:hypothetical protein
MDEPAIFGPEPIQLEGRCGQRYWIEHPFPFTGHPSADERLAGFPVLVFAPAHRPPEQTPVVLGLQGMAAPLEWNSFLVPTLLDMGVACVLLDTPAAGERSLVRTHTGEVLDELVGFVQDGVPIRSVLVLHIMQAMARDCATALRLAAERHGLTDRRVALFGVSLGALLTAYAFLRDGLGVRLLGAIGHADLPTFARSYRPCGTPVFASTPVRAVGQVIGRMAGPRVIAGFDFLAVLNELGRSPARLAQANPMHFLDRLGPGRCVRFLVGGDDRQVRPADAIACARRFPDGKCYVVPGLAHGGDGFIDHVRYFLDTQLEDWAG